MSNTTKKDFKLFTEECIYWIKKFNLTNYDVLFLHQESDDDDPCRAWVSADLESMTASMVLEIDWGWHSPDHYEVCKVAFHECCELLLNKIGIKLEILYATKQVNEWVHEIIRILENSVFEDYYTIRYRGQTNG